MKSLSFDQLQELYIEKKLPLKEIAKQLQVSVTTLNKHLNKHGMKKPVKPRTFEDIEKTIKKYNPQAKLISFGKAIEPLKIQCSCGNSFERIMSVIKTSKSCLCLSCSGYNGPATKKSHEEIREYIASHNCKLISNYTSSNQNMTIQCHCGKPFTTTYENFSKRKNHSCPDCTLMQRVQKRTHSRSEVEKVISETGCTWIAGTYENQYSKLTISCLQCKAPYQTTFTKFAFRNQIRCKGCSSSSSGYEVWFNKFLKDKKIDFLQEQTLKGAVGIGGGKLRFDFLVKNKYGVNIAVEIDGEQHEKAVCGGFKSYSDPKNFDIRRKNDQLKNEYCLQHQIPLIRISYKMFRSVKRKKEIEQEFLRIVDTHAIQSSILHHISPSHLSPNTSSIKLHPSA